MADPRICEKGGENFLPLLGDAEQDWPPVLRFILYLVGLGWCFLGVGIASDLFMDAIEKITSKTKQVNVASEHRTRTVKVWNDTVANLTLMALGSSAPEILLSVIELLTNDFYSGDLGPSTIVGSAAFNLFVIIAVCVSSIPDGGERYIKEQPVYYITAAFSLFAYGWLVIILMATSPNVVEIWEGVLTFLFFPALIILAFAADKGWLTGKTGHKAIIDPSQLSKDELAVATDKIKARYAGGKTQPTDEEILKIFYIEYTPDVSRAGHHKGAMKKILGRHADKPVLKKSTTQRVFDAARLMASPKHARVSPEPEKLLQIEDEVPRIWFQSAKYGVPEHCEFVELTLLRSGNMGQELCCGYHTEDGTAEAESDYIAPAKDAMVTFLAGEEKAVIKIKIMDDNACENDETFYVILDPPTGIPQADGEAPPQADKAAGRPRFEMGEIQKTEVTIIDDDKSPTIEFCQETVKVAMSTQKAKAMEAEILVTRTGRMQAEVKCTIQTRDDTAKAGTDYVPIETEVIFKKCQMLACVKVQIIAESRYEDAVSFDMVLSDPSEGCTFNSKTDGGEDEAVCHVEISLDEGAKNFVDMIQARLKGVRTSVQQGSGSPWLSKFTDLCSPEPENDDEPVTAWEWFMHIVTFPWQLIGALVPPKEYCDGWLAFVCSLMYIGLITALIGDLAALVGCVTGVIPDSVTAITLVALGTSLPDTFASMQAAQSDTHADASIGNVTGSNSVNVFLGLGMPWTFGSIYWAIKGGGPLDSKWNTKYAHLIQTGDVASRFHGGAFVVEAGTLANTITVFFCCACCCILILALRRKFLGCELGGPKVWQRLTSGVLVALWVIYVVVASIIAISNEP